MTKIRTVEERIEETLIEITELWNEVWWSNELGEQRRFARHALTLEDHLKTLKWEARHQ